MQNLLSLVSCNNQIVLTLVATFAAITGAAPIGIIFAVGNLCGQFFNGIGDAVKAVVSIRSTRPLWEKFELSAVKTEGAEINKPIDEITMQNLSFAYGEKQILTERDFSFVSGGKYAVCGESGQRKNHCDEAFAGGCFPDMKGVSAMMASSSGRQMSAAFMSRSATSTSRSICFKTVCGLTSRWDNITPSRKFGRSSKRADCKNL